MAPLERKNITQFRPFVNIKNAAHTRGVQAAVGWQSLVRLARGVFGRKPGCFDLLRYGVDDARHVDREGEQGVGFREKMVLIAGIAVGVVRVLARDEGLEIRQTLVDFLVLVGTEQNVLGGTRHGICTRPDEVLGSDRDLRIEHHVENDRLINNVHVVPRRQLVQTAAHTIARHESAALRMPRRLLISLLQITPNTHVIPLHTRLWVKQTASNATLKTRICQVSTTLKS